MLSILICDVVSHAICSSLSGGGCDDIETDDFPVSAWAVKKWQNIVTKYVQTIVTVHHLLLARHSYAAIAHALL
jgi:hypothetical protein